MGSKRIALSIKNLGFADLTSFDANWLVQASNRTVMNGRSQDRTVDSLLVRQVLYR
jgi:hypothetical protein|tara:strand:- start:943 stop:1110 length:168 start_codon:yes stop_codon:yes gene_type:complete